MAATYRRNLVAAIASAVVLSVVGGPHANASMWTVKTAGNAPALARSLDPQPPDTVTAFCADAVVTRVVDVSWSAVDYATSYVVYQSTTSATAGFSVVASDVTSTNWLSPPLKKGTYWYAVAAVAGAPTWISLMSDPTEARTITTNPRCT